MCSLLKEASDSSIETPLDAVVRPHDCSIASDSCLQKWTPADVIKGPYRQ